MKLPVTILATAFCTATSATALDVCLLGTWNADMDDMAAVLANQMNGSASIVSGRASMQILPNGGTILVAEDIVFKVQVPDAPEMDVKVAGYSTGLMDATGGAWNLNVASYGLVGSADVLGQTMTIPFTSATGIFGGGLGIYACNSNSLSFESTGDTPRMPRRWTR